METRIALLEEKNKTNSKRIDEHDEKIERLENTYQILENVSYRMGNLENNVEKITTKLEEKDDEKGKKWDKLIDYLFYFIIATILGYVAVKLGIK